MTAASLGEYLADSSSDLPEPIGVEAALAEIIALHQREGGATFNFYFGNLSGQALYAASVYPEQTALETGRAIKPQVLRQFFIDTQHLWNDPRNSIGTWYDAENDETYLDISTTLPDRQQMIGLGIRYNQIAIYDLAKRVEISTGGDGSDIAGLPPEDERLPPLLRGEEH